jgi:hypothetical protein
MNSLHLPVASIQADLNDLGDLHNKTLILLMENFIKELFVLQQPVPMRFNEVIQRILKVEGNTNLGQNLFSLSNIFI